MLLEYIFIWISIFFITAIHMEHNGDKDWVHLIRIIISTSCVSYLLINFLTIIRG